MALDISAGQFVLPRGPDASENSVRVAQALSQQKMLREHRDQMLQQQKEQKRNAAGTFLGSYLDPKHYLTGTQYDPVINQKLQAIMQKGSSLAADGADIPSLLQALGPDLQEVNQYSSKAQQVNKQADDMIAKMKENGYKGYDYATLKDEALKAAFHDKDPKTGADIGLKDAHKVDTDTNWIMKTIQDNPGAVTNAGDFDAFAKESPMQKTLTDQSFYDKRGGMTKQKVHLIGQNYLVPELDKNGAITDLVPQYDHANDGGEELQHTFTDVNGKQTKAPIRLLDESRFDSMMSQRKGAADYIRGQVMQHIKEYNDSSGESIDLNSPKAKLVARAIAYDELNKRKAASIENAGIYDKPSAADVNLNVYGSKQEQARERAFGSAQGKAEAGDAGYLPAGKTNTVDALHHIAMNDPDYLHGEVSEQNGRSVMDVSNMLPKAKLKYGPATSDAYKSVFYDPKDHTFLLEKKDGKFEPEVGLKELPDLLYKVAQPNGVPGGSTYAKKSLQKFGLANGGYKSAGEAPDLTRSLLEQKAANAKQGLDDFEAAGEKGLPKTLKGLHTPDGQIVGIDTRGSVRQFGGASKYVLTLKGKDGKTVDKYFKDRASLEDYMKQSTIKENSAPGPAPDKPSPPIQNVKVKKFDDKIDKYDQ